MEKVLDEMGMVVEGVRTTKAAYQLAKKQQVDMPITAALYSVLFEQYQSKRSGRYSNAPYEETRIRRL